MLFDGNDGPEIGGAADGFFVQRRNRSHIHNSGIDSSLRQALGRLQGPATMTPQAIIATRADVRTVRVLWGENRALIYASPGDIRLALDATIRFAYRAARGAGAGSDDEVGLGVDRGRFGFDPFGVAAPPETAAARQ